jgi:hypothetical protein
MIVAPSSTIDPARRMRHTGRILRLIATVLAIGLVVPMAQPARADGPTNTYPPELYPDGSEPWIGTTVWLSEGSWDPWPDSFTREWLLCTNATDVSSCAPMEGVTGSSWTITAEVSIAGETVATEGGYLRVRITAERGGEATVATSASIGPVSVLPAPQPRANSQPRVYGSQRLPWIGTQIYLDSGSWSPSYDDLTQQWLLCTDATDPANCAALVGATDSSLTVPATADLGAGDSSTVGRFIRARLTATNSAGSTEVITEAIFDPIAELPAPQPLEGSEPSIYAEELQPWVGTRVSIDSGTWSPSYDGELARQWLVCTDAADATTCSAIDGATDWSLTIPTTVDLGAGERTSVGLFVRLRLTATNSAGSTTFTTPALTDAIAGAPSLPLLRRAVTISTDQIPWVGTWAYGNTGDWSPQPDSREWSWLACPDRTDLSTCVLIAGQDSTALELTAELAGSYLRMVERASIDGGATWAEAVSAASLRAVRALGAPEFFDLSIRATRGLGVGSQVRAIGVWGPPDISVDYAWYSCSTSTSTDSCTLIAGETDRDLTLTAGMIGRHVRAQLTGTRDDFDPVVAWTPANGPVRRALMLDNGLLRFGGGGQANANVASPVDSIIGVGLLDQPFYWDAVRARWYKLTFSSFSLDIAVGAGSGDVGSSGSAGHWTGASVRDSQRNADAFTAATTVADGFVTLGTYENGVRRGYGTIVASNQVTIPTGEVLDLEHRYELGAEDSFVRITTTIRNTTATTASNVHLWVGTRDDYIGTDDSPNKYKGNIVDGEFVELTERTAPASALLVTSGAEGVLFYSTTRGVDMAHAFCCSFANSTDIDPTTAPIRRLDRDGSYALYLSVGDLPAGQSRTMVWYYGAGPLDTLGEVVRQVANAAAPQVEVGNGQLTVTWERPDIDQTITGYRIRYSSDGGESWTTVDVPPSPLSYTITGLPNGADFIVQVAALTADGPLGFSPSSEVGIPGLPTNQVLPRISGTPQATRTLSVVDADSGWTNNGNDPMTTTWQWLRDGVAIAGATSATLVVDPAWIGSTIRVEASRTNEVGTTTVRSSPTAPVVALTIGDPSPPRNLTAEPGPLSVIVDFDPPADDGGSDIVRYEMELDGSGVWTSIGTSAPYSIAGLAEGTSVTLRLRAVNADGSTSVPSETVTATAGAAAVIPEDPRDEDPAPPSPRNQPASQPSAPLPPGEIVATSDGQQTLITATTGRRRSDGTGRSLELVTGGIRLTLDVDGAGTVRTGTNGTQLLTVERDLSASFKGTGMAAGTPIDVWLMLPDGTRRHVATGLTTGQGGFGGWLPFDGGLDGGGPLPIGVRTLQFHGTDAEGRASIISVTVRIDQPRARPEPLRGSGVPPVPGTGSAMATNAGMPTPITMTIEAAGPTAAFGGEGWTMGISLAGGSGTMTSGERPVIRLVRGERAKVTGTGFLPGSRADVWLFSQPVLLGSVTVAADGTFDGQVLVDGTVVAPGEHTLQLVGVGGDGYLRAVSVGVEVLIGDGTLRPTRVETGGGTVALTGLRSLPLLLATVLGILAALPSRTRRPRAQTERA